MSRWVRWLYTSALHSGGTASHRLLNWGAAPLSTALAAPTCSAGASTASQRPLRPPMRGGAWKRPSERDSALGRCRRLFTNGAPVAGADVVILAFAVLPLGGSVLSCSCGRWWSDVRCGAGLAPLLMLDVPPFDGPAADVGAGRAMKVVVLPLPRRPEFCLPVTCVNRSASSPSKSASKAACRRRSALRDMLTRSGNRWLTVLCDRRKSLGCDTARRSCRCDE